MEGVLIASGPAFRAGAAPEGATLLDIAPTVLHLLGVPVPADMDGRVLTEILDPALVPRPGRGRPAAPPRPTVPSRSRWPTPRRRTPRSSSGWRTWDTSDGRIEILSEVVER